MSATEKLQQARITITLDLADVPLTEEVRDALACLADVMHVQAEDGLYSGGFPDADPGGEYLAPFTATRVEVEVDVHIVDTL